MIKMMIKGLLWASVTVSGVLAGRAAVAHMTFLAHVWAFHIQRALALSN